MPLKFPSPSEASPEGLLAIGGNLSAETLFNAYSQGIFPWPISKDSPMTWFCPDPRGILPTANYHVSRSFQRFLKKHSFTIRMNEDFQLIIKACAQTVRKHEVGTWITKEIERGYLELFEKGHAYCIGAYEDEILVGGLYGVCLGGLISGESMFHNKPNASKLCLHVLMSHLQHHEIPFLDTQMVTPIIKDLGGTEISRAIFLSEISSLKKRALPREALFSSDFL